MRSERRGVAQGHIQFPCNALPEMTVMEKMNVSFRGDLGMLNSRRGRGQGVGRGRVDSGEGAIASGASSQARGRPHTQADEDPVHCDISFGDAFLCISSVRRPRGERVRGSTPFVVPSDINHTEWGACGGQ